VIHKLKEKKRKFENRRGKIMIRGKRKEKEEAVARES